ncbi:MAG: class I SAM-dependent methyltransferase [Candidatus Accumulibacter sp.]|nr:class I SAM-dependent methyltransferase [Accumulibacter sp.]
MELPDHQGTEVFGLSRCVACDGLFLNPAPPAEAMARYYETFAGPTMHNPGHPVFDWLRGVAIRRELSPLLKRLADAAVIADVGAGDGQVVSFLHQQGRACLACETFPEVEWRLKEIPYCQIDLNGPLTTMLPAEGAILRHVLEHVHEPARVLAWLRRSGVRYLFVVVPNASSPFARLFGQYWAHWDPPRHLTFFTPESLRLVAERNGYREVAMCDHGIDEFVTSLYRARMIRWMRQDHGPSARSPWWNVLLHPKSLPAAISSALWAPLASTALCRLFELSGDAAFEG